MASNECRSFFLLTSKKGLQSMHFHVTIFKMFLGEGAVPVGLTLGIPPSARASARLENCGRFRLCSLSNVEHLPNSLWYILLVLFDMKVFVCLTTLELNIIILEGIFFPNTI